MNAQSILAPIPISSKRSELLIILRNALLLRGILLTNSRHHRRPLQVYLVALKRLMKASSLTLKRSKCTLCIRRQRAMFPMRRQAVPLHTSVSSMVVSLIIWDVRTPMPPPCRTTMCSVLVRNSRLKYVLFCCILVFAPLVLTVSCFFVL